ncbi:FecR family protein [Myroides marinus]|uniref:FecR family protein n=1 Tax=Myroides marinus TaxID=703342 RepID=UPI0025762366|nr:FecR family protein [Myroides marinus]MDM1375000.1 FecR family protein [Myroides marinus]MDM1532272.1 FecR family protein [Myroides marinus]MDM1539234.1 FecR family protein [Myroides marinus]
MQDKFKEILKRYLSGNADKQQEKIIEYFLQGIERKPLIDLEDIENDTVVRNSIYSKIKYQIKKSKRRRSFGLISLATTCVIILGFFIYSNNIQTNQKIAYCATENQSKSIRLSDGTLVELTSGSSLIISKDFNQFNRKVTLVGDAFFNVAKDSLKPFIVCSDNFNTQVLGTSFFVKQNLVEVLTGKVKVMDPKNQENYVILFPTDKVWLEDDRLYKNTIDILSLVSPGSLSFVFQKKTLAQWQEVIEEEMDVKIVFLFKPSNSEITVDADFRNSTMADILQSLSYLYDFEYKIENKTIIINNAKK